MIGYRGLVADQTGSDPGFYVSHQPPWPGGSLERDREDVLESLRPLPPAEEMLIEDLTQDEDRLFMAAILDT